jgi:hypothetical protein
MADGGARPQIQELNGVPWTQTAAAPELRHGQSLTVEFNVEAGLAVSKVVLVRPSSVTHGCNDEQRYIALDLVVPVEGAPPDEIIARMPMLPPSHPQITNNDVSGPPGYYMVFIVSAGGVPSEAAWIRLVP